jgi:hypothetical protein
MTAIDDAIALAREDHLVEAISNIANAQGSDDFLDHFEMVIESARESSIERIVSHSRLAIKREGGGKDRVFAIVDYWSQVTLKPLHGEVANILLRINEDCTFDQGKGIITIKE